MRIHWINKAGLVLSCFVGTLVLAGTANAQKLVGINDHVIWRASTAEQDVAFTKYADSNTKFLRVGANWNVLQQMAPSPSVPSSDPAAYNKNYLDRLDYFFQKCTTAKIRVLLCAAYAPVWAANSYDSTKSGGWAPDPTKVNDYADFCEFLLRRYTDPTKYTNAAGQHTLEAIEIWNEPDLVGSFFLPFSGERKMAVVKGIKDAGALYGNMVETAGGRIKSVRASIGASDVKVLAPVVSDVHGACYKEADIAATSTTPAIYYTSWMDAFYAVSNAPSNYDVFDWHSYWENSGTQWLPPELPACWNTTNQSQTVLGKLTASGTFAIWPKMVAHGDDLKPNWCTEIGGAAKSSAPDHNPGHLLSFAEQNTHLIDAMATLRSGNVSKLDRIYWYELFDEPNLFDPQKHGQQAYFGLLAINATNPVNYTADILLTNATITPKPAYATYKNDNKGVPVIAFNDDFNDGNSIGWTATPGTWAVVGNAYVSPHTANGAITSTGDPTWKDYSAQAKMEFSNGWKSAGLIARYNGSAGYYLRVDTSGTVGSYNIRLLKGTTIVATTAILDTYNFTAFHTVKISVKDEAGGTRILGSIDGNQHINYLDTSSPYTAGKFALRSEPWSGTVTVDDVVIASN